MPAQNILPALSFTPKCQFLESYTLTTSDFTIPDSIGGELMNKRPITLPEGFNGLRMFINVRAVSSFQSSLLFLGFPSFNENGTLKKYATLDLAGWYTTSTNLPNKTIAMWGMGMNTSYTNGYNAAVFRPSPATDPEYGDLTNGVAAVLSQVAILPQQFDLWMSIDQTVTIEVDITLEALLFFGTTL